MKIKRFLKKKAEEDRKRFETEEERAFLQRLESKIHANKAEKKVFSCRIPLIGGAIATVGCGILILVLCLVLPFSDKDIKYLAENHAQTTSNVSELNLNLRSMEFLSNDEMSISVDRVYDNISGDTLFYRLEVVNVSMEYTINAQIIIVVNEHYEYETEILADSYVEDLLLGYDISYSIEHGVDEGIGLNIFQCSAEWHLKAETIYVTNYEEYNLSEKTVFLEFLQTHFILK